MKQFNNDKTDYQRAQEYQLTNINRWAKGIEHHPWSVRIFDFLDAHDFNDYDDHFCWKSGGDGDNGEALMYQLDAFFELLSLEEQQADFCGV